MERKSQAAIEYLIIIGFVTFAIMGILVVAYFYSNTARDRIRLNQLEIFTSKIINSAEAVYYSGEPSKATFAIYIPEGVHELTIPDIEPYILIKMSTGNGELVRVFDSNVALNGSITASPGVKTVVIEAKQNYVQIN
ncbi:MAG: hypothetical protein ABIE22_02715 [archaeon]